jgi:hypothetical protein
VAVYYYAALWPWNMSTILTLDDEPEDLVDLRDKSDSDSLHNPIGHAKATQSFDIRWSRDGLINEEHTLMISMGNGTKAQWAIVDKLASVPSFPQRSFFILFPRQVHYGHFYFHKSKRDRTT